MGIARKLLVCMEKHVLNRKRAPKSNHTPISSGASMTNSNSNNCTFSCLTQLIVQLLSCKELSSLGRNLSKFKDELPLLEELGMSMHKWLKNY